MGRIFTRMEVQIHRRLSQYQPNPLPGFARERCMAESAALRSGASSYLELFTAFSHVLLARPYAPRETTSVHPLVAYAHVARFQDYPPHSGLSCSLRNAAADTPCTARKRKQYFDAWLSNMARPDSTRCLDSQLGEYRRLHLSTSPTSWAVTSPFRLGPIEI